MSATASAGVTRIVPCAHACWVLTGPHSLIYLTLSPNEWAWKNLGEYLQKINPDLVDKSISELVTTDPITTSHFIDNKLSPFYNL